MLWIEPAKRERKAANYSVDKYYQAQMRPNAVIKPEKPKVPRAPKQLNMCVLGRLIEDEGWLFRSLIRRLTFFFLFFFFIVCLCCTAKIISSIPHDCLSFKSANQITSRYVLLVHTFWDERRRKGRGDRRGETRRDMNLSIDPATQTDTCS